MPFGRVFETLAWGRRHVVMGANQVEPDDAQRAAAEDAHRQRLLGGSTRDSDAEVGHAGREPKVPQRVATVEDRRQAYYQAKSAPGMARPAAWILDAVLSALGAGTGVPA